jgi:hypothetical protein
MLSEYRNKIINRVRLIIEIKKINSIQTINQTFISRKLDNLHMCICISTVSYELRTPFYISTSPVNYYPLN